MLQAFVWNVSSISDACCKCFIWILHMFQWLYIYVASVYSKYFICFRRMLQVFISDITYVAVAIRICCKRILQIFHLFQMYVAEVFLVVTLYRHVCHLKRNTYAYAHTTWKPASWSQALMHVHKVGDPPHISLYIIVPSTVPCFMNSTHQLCWGRMLSRMMLWSVLKRGGRGHSGLAPPSSSDESKANGWRECKVMLRLASTQGVT
jgi:hypothetical protein